MLKNNEKNPALIMMKYKWQLGRKKKEKFSMEVIFIHSSIVWASFTIRHKKKQRLSTESLYTSHIKRHVVVDAFPRFSFFFCFVWNATQYHLQSTVNFWLYFTKSFAHTQALRSEGKNMMKIIEFRTLFSRGCVGCWELGRKEILFPRKSFKGEWNSFNFKELTIWSEWKKK